MLVPKVDAKSGEAVALVVFQVALVVLCLPALYYCSNPNVRPWRPFAFFMIQHCWIDNVLSDSAQLCWLLLAIDDKNFSANK